MINKELSHENAEAVILGLFFYSETPHLSESFSRVKYA